MKHWVELEALELLGRGRAVSEARLELELCIFYLIFISNTLLYAT